MKTHIQNLSGLYLKHLRIQGNRAPSTSKVFTSSSRCFCRGLLYKHFSVYCISKLTWLSQYSLSFSLLYIYYLFSSYTAPRLCCSYCPYILSYRCQKEKSQSTNTEFGSYSCKDPTYSNLCVLQMSKPRYLVLPQSHRLDTRKI